MATSGIPGRKVRAIRTRAGLTQAGLGEQFGISPSYLNLIEHDRRSLSAVLLVRLAQTLDLDLRAIAEGLDARLVADLLEVFADPLFEAAAPPESEVRDLALSSPDAARAIARLHQAYAAAQNSARALAAQVLDREDVPGMASAELSPDQVTEFLQKHSNHFPELEAEAERVWKDGHLQGEDLFTALTHYMEQRLGSRCGMLRSARWRSGAPLPAGEEDARSPRVLRRGSRNSPDRLPDHWLAENSALLDRSPAT